MIRPGAFVRLKLAFDDRPINFDHGSIFELRGESLGRTNMSRKNNRPGNRSVKPVWQAEVDVAFFDLPLAVEGLHLLLQAIDACGRLRQHSGRLVDDEA